VVNTPLSCGASPAVWDHTVLPVTRHRRTRPAVRAQVNSASYLRRDEKWAVFYEVLDEGLVWLFHWSVAMWRLSLAADPGSNCSVTVGLGLYCRWYSTRSQDLFECCWVNLVTLFYARVRYYNTARYAKKFTWWPLTFDLDMSKMVEDYTSEGSSYNTSSITSLKQVKQHS